MKPGLWCAKTFAPGQRNREPRVCGRARPWQEAGWGEATLNRRPGQLTGSHPGSGQMLNTGSRRAAHHSTASGQSGRAQQTVDPKGTSSTGTAQRQARVGTRGQRAGRLTFSTRSTNRSLTSLLWVSLAATFTSPRDRFCGAGSLGVLPSAPEAGGGAGPSKSIHLPPSTPQRAEGTAAPPAGQPRAWTVTRRDRAPEAEDARGTQAGLGHRP